MRPLVLYGFRVCGTIPLHKILAFFEMAGALVIMEGSGALNAVTRGMITWNPTPSTVDFGV